jgi:hypothetical protein
MCKVSTKICILTAALLVLCSASASETMATTFDEQLCDAPADIALATGDYPMAIELHSVYAIKEKRRAGTLSSGICVRHGGTRRRRNR